MIHMMHAFMGKRPDHAPIEVTAFRLRLGAGVERGTCHFFPSPMYAGPSVVIRCREQNVLILSCVT